MQNKKSENTLFLENRLNFNEKYSNNNFHKWLFNKFDNISYTSVLDVGCGMGKQTFYFNEKNKSAKVCGFDISDNSIQHISDIIKNKKIKNTEVHVGDINHITDTIKKFNIDSFDLIHSSFALYYANNELQSLRAMYDVLENHGTMIISSPHGVNTFLNFLSKYQEIPQLSWDCLNFIDDIVLGFYHKNFMNIKTNMFINNLYVDSSDDLIENYRASTFYNKKIENKIFNEIKNIISQNGFFHIQKNSKVAIANGKLN